MALFTKFSHVFSSQNFCNNLTTISGYNTVLLQINKVMVLQFNFITLLFGLNIKQFLRYQSVEFQFILHQKQSSDFFNHLLHNTTVTHVIQ